MNTRTSHSNPWPDAFMLAVLLTVLTFFAATPAYGQATSNPPGQMTFQGFLTDASTPPVPLGDASPENKAITFKIYKDAQSTDSADVLWAEDQIVTVDKGHFSVLLGEGSAVSGFPHNADLSGVFTGVDASDRWIGITVDAAEIVPRIRFFPAPYAQLARRARVADIATSLRDAGGATDLVTTQAGRMEVAGELAVNPGPFSLTGNATVSGTLSVTGQSTFTGNVGIGTTIPGNKLEVSGGGVLLSGGYGGASTFNTLTLGGGSTTPNAGSLAWGNNGGWKLNFGTPVSSTFTPRVTFVDTGNVGIGTVSPRSKLEVDGNVILKGATGGESWSNQRLMWGGDGTGYPLYFASINNAGAINASVLTMLDNGRVGIGTTTPRVPLDVVGFLSYPVTDSPDGFGPDNGFNGTNPLGTAGGGNFNVSILANGWVAGAGMVAYSDRRIKDIVGLSDPVKDLEIIQRLRVTDYRMMDKVAAGNALHKGFIAQEVEAVISEAVTSSRSFIPNIYSLPSSIQYDERRQTLAVTLPKPHELKVGDRVRIIAEQSQLESSVSEVPSATEFVVEKIEKNPKQVFVYGKEVLDFRTLNYDQVFTTGIGAIQELARQVESLKANEARIAELEAKTARMAELEAKASRVDSLEREFSELKKLVALMAQSPTRNNGVVASSDSNDAGE